MEEGGGRAGRVTYAQTGTYIDTPCGTAVNHNMDELAWASIELGRIIYGGREDGREGGEGWSGGCSLFYCIT